MSPPPEGARPLLLLDVDGVLLASQGSAWDDAADDDADRPAEPQLNPATAGWLAELGRAFDLCWATTWEDEANRALGPLLGLPDLPFIEFDFDYRARTSKLRSAAAWVGDRACAWIDDDLHADADAWAAGRTSPTLLVHVDMIEGMARRHVDELLNWAASLRGESSR